MTTRYPRYGAACLSAAALLLFGAFAGATPPKAQLDTDGCFAATGDGTIVMCVESGGPHHGMPYRQAMQFTLSDGKGGIAVKREKLAEIWTEGTDGNDTDDELETVNERYKSLGKLKLDAKNIQLMGKAQGFAAKKRRPRKRVVRPDKLAWLKIDRSKVGERELALSLARRGGKTQRHTHKCDYDICQVEAVYWIKASRVFVVEIYTEAVWGPDTEPDDREDLSYLEFVFLRAPGEPPLTKTAKKKAKVKKVKP